MLNMERVTQTLCALSSLEAEEILPYAVLVQNCASAVEGALIDPHYAEDDRIIFLAAARAYYCLSLSGAGTGGVSDFAAGDVKISMKAQPSDNALTLYRTAAEAAAGMVRDTGFVFREV